MPIRIEILSLVPEDKLVETVALFSASAADIITAINDNKNSESNKNTFTIESTFLGGSPAGSPITFDGKVSTFGGPDDLDVGPDEGLSLFDVGDVAANPDLFLPTQPPGTTGLARRLNPQAKYLACRWNLSVTPKSFLKMATTVVKVTNPANGRSENARAADTGPAVFTERVADLSPHLADALGLPTDGICHVEIPTPAGAQLSAGTGVAVGVNPATIDATIFPNDMKRKLVVMTTIDETTYWVINQIGPEAGGQSLLRRKDNHTEILLSDTTVFPVKASDKVPAVVAAELNKFISNQDAGPTGPAGTPPGPGEDVNAKVFATAKAFVGQDTRHVPDTEEGKLACAWAVNEVVRRAFGKPISMEEDGRSNGLTTGGIFAALKEHHTQVAGPSAGRIIISPTPPTGSVHGHVGIVGENSGGSVDNTEIFSNSSAAREFAQNHTIRTWKAFFSAQLHLEVLFFELRGDQF
jgi:hypothetical protein